MSHLLEAEDGQLQTLVQTCLDDPKRARLLRFLAGCPSTVMTVTDLAAAVDCRSDEVETAIRGLSERGLLRQVEVHGLEFYGLAETPAVRSQAQQFRLWCEDQRNRWQALGDLLDCA